MRFPRKTIRYLGGLRTVTNEELKKFGSAKKFWCNLVERACQPTSSESLALFRITFGTLLVYRLLIYLRYGWFDTNYVQPRYTFHYLGFEWAQNIPDVAMYSLLAAIIISAGCIAVGFCYRLSALLFTAGYLFLFLFDKTNYLNHDYLICLFGAILICVPAHQRMSIDAEIRPRLRSGVISAWPVWLLRFQVGIVYFYGGLAKLNTDWLHGDPVRLWLHERAESNGLASYLTSEWGVMLLSYGGIFFDLLIVPALLWKRTRIAAFLVTCGFHVANSFLWNIGIFPWLMIAATTIFLPADWLQRLRLKSSHNLSDSVEHTFYHLRPTRLRAHIMVLAIVLYSTMQILVPLRHFLYPGNVNWTEEGHRFAWHMMLRHKRGESIFYVKTFPHGYMYSVEPREYLSERQVFTMSGTPDMVLQFAHFLEGEFRKKGASYVEVRARVRVSLNGRKPQDLINPDLNLANEQSSIWPAHWILPLQQE